MQYPRLINAVGWAELLEVKEVDTAFQVTFLEMLPTCCVGIKGKYFSESNAMEVFFKFVYLLQQKICLALNLLVLQKQR